MPAFYNENDPYAAHWLDTLQARDLVPWGQVDSRSITELSAADVAGHGQRHFFGGIGGWGLAARLAGVPDYSDIWTGSCPCQPLSDAGKRLGESDPRHLWPAWFELIRQCQPPIIFGEQVASQLGLRWLDLVRRDLEGCGYAFGASDLCAAGVGAPHIRQRLYFVAIAGGERREGVRLLLRQWRSRQRVLEARRRGAVGDLGDAQAERRNARTGADGRTAIEPRGSGGVERIDDRAIPDDEPHPNYFSVDRAMGDAAGDLFAGSAGHGRMDRAQATEPPRVDRDHRAQHAGADRGDARAADRMVHAARDGWGEGGDRVRARQPDAPETGAEHGGGILGNPSRHGVGEHAGELRGVGEHAGGLRGDEGEHDIGTQDRHHAPVAPSTVGDDELADHDRAGRQGRRSHAGGARSVAGRRCGPSDHRQDVWDDLVWLPCLDGKARPTKPGLEPLAHGVSGRMAVRRAIEQGDAAHEEEDEHTRILTTEEGKILEHWYNRVGALAGFGNAIVPQVAAAFIVASLEAAEELVGT